MVSKQLEVKARHDRLIGAVQEEEPPDKSVFEWNFKFSFF